MWGNIHIHSYETTLTSTHLPKLLGSKSSSSSFPVITSEDGCWYWFELFATLFPMAVSSSVENKSKLVVLLLLTLFWVLLLEGCADEALAAKVAAAPKSIGFRTLLAVFFLLSPVVLSELVLNWLLLDRAEPVLTEENLLLSSVAKIDECS